MYGTRGINTSIVWARDQSIVKASIPYWLYQGINIYHKTCLETVDAPSDDLSAPTPDATNWLKSSAAQFPSHHYVHAQRHGQWLETRVE
jgi:hypothetical protein